VIEEGEEEKEGRRGEEAAAGLGLGDYDCHNGVA